MRGKTLWCSVALTASMISEGAFAQPSHTGLPEPEPICVGTPIPVPRTRYVDDSAPAGGNGLGWNTAFNDIQTALAQAAANPATPYNILVGQGTYRPTTTTDRTIAFELLDNTTIRGGYAGYGAPTPGARDIDLYVTTLSGDIGTAGVASDNSYNVVFASWSVTRSALLEGVTVRDGYGDGWWGVGGGIYLQGATPRIYRCTITANYAIRGGGVATSAYSARPEFVRCRFLGNTAVDAGGGMSIEGGSAVIANCTFDANACSDLWGYGGAVAAAGWTSGCGGIGLAGGPDEGPARGDGRDAEGSIPSGAGAGASSVRSSLDLFIVNTVFTNNTAYNGGAIQLYQPALIANSTFSLNTAQADGGGIGDPYGYESIVSNCILWQNTDTVGTMTDQEAQIFDPYGALFGNVNYTCVQGLTGSLGGTGNIGTNPLFRSPGGGDFRLQWTSPSVDTGFDGLIPPDVADLDGDQGRLEATPLDRDDRTRISCRVDRGAYEFNDCNGNRIDDFVDIAGGTADTNVDGIPDSCQDCNGNGVPDPVDIRNGVADCNGDGVPDSCQGLTLGDCNHNGQLDVCEGCAVDLVYVLDTSGSMCPELPDVCNMIEQVRSGLTAQGLDVRVTVFGISSCGYCSEASCIQYFVDADLSRNVPCNPGPCGTTLQDEESWGPASAIVAERFPWRQGAKRYVLPVSDEGPCWGDPCDDTPGSDDDLSIQNAILVCNQNGVDALPITGSFAWSCVLNEAARLAVGTGTGVGYHYTSYGSYATLGVALQNYIRGVAPNFCGSCPTLHSACARLIDPDSASDPE